VRLRPRLDRPLLNRLAGIGNNQIEIELDDVSETMTRRARAEGVVERKQPWLGCFVGEVAVLTLEPLAEDMCFRIFDGEGCAAGFAVSHLDRIRQPRPHVTLELHAIDDHFQR
jgi:hypothetical protein